MVPYFPKQISLRAVSIYLISLITIYVMYISYSMSIEYIIIGILSVFSFFFFSSSWTQKWAGLTEKKFVEQVFIYALLFRLIWVLFSYFYYQSVNGSPFEYGAADSMGYHSEALWLASEPWSVTWDYYFGPGAFGVSDVGYPLYLTMLYRLFGPVIIIPRLLKALMSAFTCILVYRLSARTFGEETGRLAGIMCALMPNLILYCGYHLKETEMMFVIVLFLERLDYLIRSDKASFWSIFPPTILAIGMFFFRTVLGMSALFTFGTAVLISSTPTMKKGWKRAALIGWGVLAFLTAGGGTIATEVESYWENRDENLSNKRMDQTLQGNRWAQYATGTVMAPMAFVLPFATMVDVDQQYGQQEKHGGNYVRNFMGFFALLAIYEAFRRKKWRSFTIIGAFAVSYLGVISLTGFSNSERFLLPALPCLIMMWAYGISTLRKETYKLLIPWSFIVLAMEIGWAFFKLGSRSLF